MQESTNNECLKCLGRKNNTCNSERQRFPNKIPHKYHFSRKKVLLGRQEWDEAGKAECRNEGSPVIGQGMVAFLDNKVGTGEEEDQVSLSLRAKRVLIRP